MPTVQIPIVGPSYKHRSLPLSAQVTRNWYPEYNKEAESPIALLPTPGAKAFSSGTFGEDRGLYEFGGTVFKVTADNLYSIDADGVSTYLAKVVGGNRVSFADDGTNLVIVAGGTVNIWDGATMTQPSTNFESPNFVAFLNQKGIYDGTGQRVQVSDSGNITTITGGSVGIVESNSDDVRRPYAFQDKLYMFGDKTVEPWYDTGAGNPPIASIEGSVSTVGLGADHSVAHNENIMYFLANNRTVYQLVGANLKPVSTIPLVDAFKGYAVVTDAIGWCFRFQDQNFYYLTFPNADKTWCYSEELDAWFEMSTGVEGGKHFATSYVFAYDKHLVANGADVLEWDKDTFTDDGTTIRRVRATATIDGSSLDGSLIGKPLEMVRLELIMEKGTGLTTGQGSDPEIMMRYSDDGGHTWETGLWRKIGQSGQYKGRVEWHVLGQFRQRILEFAVSDSVDWSIYRCGADIEVGV